MFIAPALQVIDDQIRCKGQLQCDGFQTLMLHMNVFQAPIFISMFLGLRKMANAPVESLTTGGMLWFKDLTVVDPYFCLPLLTACTLALTLEVNYWVPWLYLHVSLVWCSRCIHSETFQSSQPKGQQLFPEKTPMFEFCSSPQWENVNDGEFWTISSSNDMKIWIPIRFSFVVKIGNSDNNLETSLMFWSTVLIFQDEGFFRPWNSGCQAKMFFSRALLLARSDSTSHSAMSSIHPVVCLSVAGPPPPHNWLSWKSSSRGTFLQIEPMLKSCKMLTKMAAKGPKWATLANFEAL